MYLPAPQPRPFSKTRTLTALWGGALSAAEVSLRRGDVAVSVGRIEAPAGVAYRNGDVTVEDLMVTLLELTLATLGKGDDARGRTEAAPKPAGAEGEATGSPAKNNRQRPHWHGSGGPAIPMVPAT